MTTAPIHRDTAEALAVSRPLIGKATGSYGREAHLLLTPAAAAGATGIDPNATPRHAFRLAGADFSVESRPIAFDRAAGTPADVNGPDWRPVASHKAIVRTDLNRTLGIVGKNYTPIQNEALLNLFEYLREDAQIENIIVLNGGAKVVVSASIAVEAEVREGDTIRRYLHAFNGHDGGTALGVFFSDLRLVCANQLRFITGRGSRSATRAGEGVRARHTSGGADLAKKLPQLIDLQQQRFRREVEELQLMLPVRVTPEAANHILTATFSDKLAKPVKVERGSDETRERTLSDLPEVETIRSHFARGTGIGIDPRELSVYNLFQATTQWASHDAGRAKDDVERARTRLEALWGGTLSQRIDRCRTACLEVAAAA